MQIEFMQKVPRETVYRYRSSTQSDQAGYLFIFDEKKHSNDALLQELKNNSNIIIPIKVFNKVYDFTIGIFFPKGFLKVYHKNLNFGSYWIFSSSIG